MCSQFKPDRLINSNRSRHSVEPLAMSIHSKVQFSPWLERITKRDSVFRMIGKTRATKDMSLSEKKRIALSIMTSPLQKKSIGARQYAMAIALEEAQKKIKVQPIGFFTMGDENEEDDLPVRRITWGTVETKLVSYDIPFEIPNDTDDTTKETTERNMKKQEIQRVNQRVREYQAAARAARAAAAATARTA